MVKQKLSSKIAKYKRVWRLLKKPSKKEFLTISKVAAIGLALIGVMGFLISFILGYLNW